MALEQGPITMIVCSTGPRGRGRRCQTIRAEICPDCEEPIVVSVTADEPTEHHQCQLPGM